MGILCILVLVAIYASWKGYAVYAWVSLAVLYGIMYAVAPKRKFPTAEAVSEGVDLKGKVALITGPTSGIGVETARVLALRGAHVLLAARSAKKLEETKKEIEDNIARNHGARAQVTCLECDLNDLQSVKRCAKEFESMNIPLHILINNAGIMALPTREATAQGLEKQVGVCHVGHFLLTKLLLPYLEKSTAPNEPSRVVCVSSMAVTMADSDFLQHARLETTPYDQWAAYGNAKSANLLHAQELHKRYSKNGVMAFSLHPGGIHTGLQSHVDWWTMLKWYVVTPLFFKSVEQGAATTITCATKAGIEEHGGKWFDNCKPTETATKIEKKLECDNPGAKLWEMTEKLLEELNF
jgi:NAD(P)-dependent dehydrogenase (short-subunit alcohol dehydrogenase family)